MTEITNNFFTAYMTAFSAQTYISKDIPKEMISTHIDKTGWVEWRLLKGSIQEKQYEFLEEEFNVKFPKSFIKWHKDFYFLDADIIVLRLPISNPNLPLQDLRKRLNWYIPKQLIPHKLYPFAEEGNDIGPLVFDGRIDKNNNEFPIRYYDHEFGGDLEGLSEIIFSSFEKLLECLTHFMVELKTRESNEIIPDFFKIDPTGAGLTGKEYWLAWTDLLRKTDVEFGDGIE